MKLEEISDLMKENLNEFPIFNQNHRINTKKIRDDKFWIGYRTAKDNSLKGTTNFDLNIIGDTCYILWIELAKEHQGKNLGKLLYKTIENFAKDYGCKRVRLTPSGWTPKGKTRLEYMKSLGYKETKTIEIEKILK